MCLVTFLSLEGRSHFGGVLATVEAAFTLSGLQRNLDQDHIGEGGSFKAQCRSSILGVAVL